MSTLTFTNEDIYKGDLILVNAEHPLVRYSPRQLDAVNVNFPHISLEKCTVDFLSACLSYISCGDEIVPVSGYRTRQEQEDIYSTSLVENGEDFTQKYVALPNHSEHQTGLAIDLGQKSESIDFIRPNFPYFGICQSFRQTAPKYGFIQRYQLGKEAVTGISAEPWHFRFVGYPHSAIIAKQNYCLEEYIQKIKEHTYAKNHLHFKDEKDEFEIFYLPISSQEPVSLCVPANCTCQVSGNNYDGVIITLQRRKNE
ncbi:MAG: D-alanyl-D-alanine carboxypeptidase family protein [Oscillospiraceae bacterium]